MKNVMNLVSYLIDKTDEFTEFDDGFVCRLTDEQADEINDTVSEMTADWGFLEWNYLNNNPQLLNEVSDKIISASNIYERIEWEMIPDFDEFEGKGCDD